VNNQTTNQEMNEQNSYSYEVIDTTDI